MENDIVTAFAASLPERVTILEKAVKSILPQVDAIQVVLNNFLSVPDFLQHPKINVLHHDNSMEDGSRFIGIEEAVPGFTLVFDDDIIYPQDYVSTLMEKARGRAVMVTPMGKILAPRPIKSYYGNILKSFKTFSEVKEDALVEVPGACGVLWDNTIVKVRSRDMLIPNSDICLAKFCKDNGVQPIVIAHSADWLTNIWNEVKGAPSIYGKYRRYDGVLTQFVNDNL